MILPDASIGAVLGGWVGWIWECGCESSDILVQMNTFFFILLFQNVVVSMCTCIHCAVKRLPFSHFVIWECGREHVLIHPWGAHAIKCHSLLLWQEKGSKLDQDCMWFNYTLGEGMLFFMKFCSFVLHHVFCFLSSFLVVRYLAWEEHNNVRKMAQFWRLAFGCDKSWLCVQAARQRDKPAVVEVLPTLIHCENDRAYEDTFLHAIISYLIPFGEDFATDEFCAAVFDDFLLVHYFCYSAVLKWLVVLMSVWNSKPPSLGESLFYGSGQKQPTFKVS